MTAGWDEGVSMGEWRGEPLFHASLAPEAYESELVRHGFRVERDARADGGGAWLGRRDG